MADLPKRESRTPRVAQGQTDDAPHDDDTLDLTHRDPHHHTAHLKLMFDDIFSEPHPSVHSYDRVWNASFQVFRTTRTICYQLTTLVCAVPASLFWGLYFALLSCCSVWCCRPCIRAFQIHLHCLKEICSPVANGCLRPFAEILGACCNNFKIVLLQRQNGSGEERNLATQQIERSAEEQGFII